MCSPYKILATIVVSTLTLTLIDAQLHYFQQPTSSLYRTQYQLDSSSLASSPSLAIASGDYSVAHPAVIANAERESHLPSELRKSDRFYSNPRIAAGLARDSWFTDKEMPVLDREAEKIPRNEIYKLFHNAGWVKRR